MDAINPKHYQSFSNGAEAIDILENLVSNCANTAKYAIRSGRLDGDNKTDTLPGRLQDMKKARWYAIREVARLEKLIAEEKKGKENTSDEPEAEEPESKKTAFRAVLPHLHEENAEYQWVTSEEEAIVEADLTVRMELEDYTAFLSTNQRLSHPSCQDYHWVLSCEKK